MRNPQKNILKKAFGEFKVMTSKQIGDYGENAAAAYLRYKGCEILKRNFSIRGGEIDIIAVDNEDRYIFAEVKTRRRTDYGAAAEFVDTHKRERIKRTALAFLGRDDVDMRFDVIEVYYGIALNKITVTKINHIKNAF